MVYPLRPARFACHQDVVAETVDIREHTDHRITESMIERTWMPMHAREPAKMPEHVG
jgi:hypothetical protein